MSYLTSVTNITSTISSSLSDLLNNNAIYHNRFARIGFATIGAALFLSTATTLTKGIFSILQKPLDLKERYGKGTWAVITGATDGIGKEFAFKLASMGFNIVLISRTQEKLDKTAREIRHKCSQTQVKTICCDFNKCYEESFVENLHTQLNDLDVSMLVNNVGVYPTGLYKDFSIGKIKEVVYLNCLTHSLMTRIILPKMVLRKQKSGIINMSSSSGRIKTPLAQLYSASKGFLSHLALGIQLEYPNIDMLAYEPNYVSTSMTGHTNFIVAITPEQCVNGALVSLGKTSSTFGNWKHRVLGYFAINSPDWLQAKVGAMFVKSV